MQISPPVVHYVACGLIHLNLLAKKTTKLFLVGILFLLFLDNFDVLLGLLYFPREVFNIMYEDILHGHYSLPLNTSYFRFILLLLGDINLNPGTAPLKINDILSELLPFHNCIFSTGRMDYQPDPLSVVGNNAWKISQKRSMHFVHVKINSLLTTQF